MIRAAKLDFDLYNEVEVDNTASWQAFIVVIFVSLATGIGMGINGLLWDDQGILYLLWASLLALGYIILGWLMLAIVVYSIGISIFKTKETEADYGQLLRTLGFALTPGILVFFIFVPFLGTALYLTSFIWMMIAGVIAVRQALEFSTLRALGTCIAGIIPYLILFAFLNWLFS